MIKRRGRIQSNQAQAEDGKAKYLEKVYLKAFLSVEGFYEQRD
jgi:hypothetical protein